MWGMCSLAELITGTFLDTRTTAHSNCCSLLTTVIHCQVVIPTPAIEDSATRIASDAQVTNPACGRAHDRASEPLSNRAQSPLFVLIESQLKNLSTGGKPWSATTVSPAPASAPCRNDHQRKCSS